MTDESLRFLRVCSEAIQVSKRKPKPYHRSRSRYFIAIDLTGNFSIITIRLESSSTVALSENERLPFCPVLAKQFKFPSVSSKNPPFPKWESMANTADSKSLRSLVLLEEGR